MSLSHHLCLTAGKSDIDHLDNLFKSIKSPHPGAKPFIPKLAFTPTQVLHQTYSNPKTSEQSSTTLQQPVPSFSASSLSLNPAALPQSYGPIRPVTVFPNNIHPFMMRPPFYPYPDPRFAGAGLTMPYNPFVQRPPLSSSSFKEPQAGRKNLNSGSRMKNVSR